MIPSARLTPNRRQPYLVELVVVVNVVVAVVRLAVAAILGVFVVLTVGVLAFAVVPGERAVWGVRCDGSRGGGTYVAARTSGARRAMVEKRMVE